MALKTNPLLKPRSELKDGIENLKPLVREIANAFVARAETMIAALGEAVNNLPNPESDSKAAQRQEKLLDEMQDLVVGLKVKPGKGRLKDLHRVRDVLDALDKLVQDFAK
jgi:hypothetical protein